MTAELEADFARFEAARQADLRAEFGDPSGPDPVPLEADEFERDPSWKPIDLGPAWRGEKTRPEATVFLRDDGVALLLPGVNYLHGDSGDGKSLVALIAALAELRARRDVIWISYEDPSEDLIVDRLRLLGASGGDIEGLWLITPQEGMTHGAAYVANLAVETGARLVVLDSVGEAMAVGGVNEDLDREVGPWFRQTLRAIADTAPGVSVLPIDHSTKAKDNPLFPSGSKRKRAAVSGRAYLLNVRQPFGIGVLGYVQLVVAKDRGGTFKRGDIAAEIKLDATATPYEVTVSGPRGGDNYSVRARRNAVERVREVLGDALVPITAEEIARIANGPDRTRAGEGPLAIRTVQNALTKLAEGPEVTKSDQPPTGAGRLPRTVWQCVLSE